MYNYLKMKQIDQPINETNKAQYTALPQLELQGPNSRGSV